MKYSVVQNKKGEFLDSFFMGTKKSSLACENYYYFTNHKPTGEKN